MELMTCKRCERMLPPSEMFKQRTRKGVVVPTPCCLKCNTQRHKEYYEKNRAKRVAAMRQYHARQVAAVGGRVRPKGESKWRGIREFLAWIKEAVPCADCSKTYPYCAMDFDHVRGDKLFNVGMVMGSAVTDEQLWAEIQKCELVCANCHRIRTFKRKNPQYVVKPVVS